MTHLRIYGKGSVADCFSSLVSSKSKIKLVVIISNMIEAVLLRLFGKKIVERKVILIYDRYALYVIKLE